MNKKTYYLTNNRCYKAAKSIGTKKGIIVHSTGAINKTLKRYIQPNDGKLGENKYDNDWNRSDISKCVHAMIGEIENGDVWVYEILPYQYACWGCGSGTKGSYNYSPNGHIQFEILEGADNDSDYFKRAWNTAVEYCAWLCKTYGFSISDIVSHKEAHDKGYASNHGDADSYFKKFGKTMSNFRNDVKKKMANSTISNNTSSSTATKTIKFMKINTSSANLNCRKTASSSGSVIGQFKKDQEIQYISTNGEWIKVKGKSTNGNLITGYCSSAYLKTSTSSKNIVTVNTSSANLNCRKTASDSGKVLGQFAKGQNLILLKKKSSSWYQVKGMDINGDVITGYCSATYLK